MHANLALTAHIDWAGQMRLHRLRLKLVHEKGRGARDALHKLVTHGNNPELTKFAVLSTNSENTMQNMRNIGAIIAVTGLFALPFAAQSQGIAGGAAQGAQQGGEAAGPLGAAVGGAVGGVAGGVAGLLGVDQRPRFRDYVIREHRSVYRLREPVTVGTVLPPEGVTFYAIPREFGVPPSYRYAVVNDEVVLVDPVTREIVDVVD